MYTRIDPTGYDPEAGLQNILQKLREENHHYVSGEVNVPDNYEAARDYAYQASNTVEFYSRLLANTKKFGSTLLQENGPMNRQLPIDFDVAAAQQFIKEQTAVPHNVKEDYEVVKAASEANVSLYGLAATKHKLPLWGIEQG